MSINKKINTHIPHNLLSNKIWEKNMIMKKDIKDKLVTIAESFIDYLGVSIDVKDITVTGSYANYNYTPYSDIDLHIIVNYDELTDIEDLPKEFFHAKKSFWNDRHDIKIKGIEVELYAQDESEQHSSTGVYSIITDTWIVQPKKFKTKIDNSSIKEKYKKIKKEIDESIKNSNKSKDAKHVERMLEKIRKMRKSGLEKGGEMSDENLTYKILRNEGEIQKLFDLKDKLFDISMSF